MATTSDPTEKQKAVNAGTYDVPDVAALLKCSERHVRRMIDAGEIPGMIRVGRLVRFVKTIVDQHLVAMAKRPTQLATRRLS